MDRAAAYQRKFGIIVECVGDLPDPKGLTRLEKDGLLHRVQVAVDAAMDVAAMWVKDRGSQVSDDYGNLRTLAEEEVISGPLAQQLVRLNGLRNAIVHKYNSFEEEILFTDLDAIQATLLEFAQAAEGST